MNAKLLYDGIICKLNGTSSSASVPESQWKSPCHFCSVGHQPPTIEPWHLSSSWLTVVQPTSQLPPLSQENRYTLKMDSHIFTEIGSLQKCIQHKLKIIFEWIFMQAMVFVACLIYFEFWPDQRQARQPCSYLMQLHVYAVSFSLYFDYMECSICNRCVFQKKCMFPMYSSVLCLCKTMRYASEKHSVDLGKSFLQCCSYLAFQFSKGRALKKLNLPLNPRFASSE